MTRKYESTIGLRTSAGFIRVSFEFDHENETVTARVISARNLKGIGLHGTKTLTFDEYENIRVGMSDIEFFEGAAKLFGICISRDNDDDFDDIFFNK